MRPSKTFSALEILSENCIFVKFRSELLFQSVQYTSKTLRKCLVSPEMTKVGFSYSKTETELSTSVLPTISGNSVSIISTDGDFPSRGLQVSATTDDASAPTLTTAAR
jgi:hypothetical protein